MVADRGPQLEAAVLALLVLCVLAVSLRTYTMGIILKRFFLEDYLAILALVCCRSPSACARPQSAEPLGIHVRRDTMRLSCESISLIYMARADGLYFFRYFRNDRHSLWARKTY